ncbi:MAG: hypothetical protein ABH862_07055, partial [Candidatus Omnitrophota bacterium]
MSNNQEKKEGKVRKMKNYAYPNHHLKGEKPTSVNRFFYKTIVYIMVFTLMWIGVPLPLPQYAPRPVRTLQGALDMKEAQAEQEQVTGREEETVTFVTGDGAKIMTLSRLVEMDKSFVVVGGACDTAAGEQAMVASRHTDGYSVLQIKGSGKAGIGNIKAQVVEYGHGIKVIKGASALEPGDGQVITTLAETMPDDRSFVLISGMVAGQNRNNTGAIMTGLLQTSVGGEWTELLVDRNDIEGSAVAEWQIIAFDNCEVYGGTFAFSGTSMTRDGNASYPSIGDFLPVTKANSFVVVQNRAADTNDMVIRGEVTDTDTLTFSRVSSTGTNNVVWYLVEMNDGSTVEHGTQVLSGTSTPKTLTTKVDDTESWSLISTSSDGTQDAAFVMHELATGTDSVLTFTTNAASTGTVAYQVINSPAINIIAPDGGETLIVGDPYNINWYCSNKTTNVKIEYSDDGGSAGGNTWNTIISSITGSDEIYEWTVGKSDGSGTFDINPANEIDADCFIRISDASDSTIKDESTVAFTIKSKLTIEEPISTPWGVGDTTRDIQWKYWGNFTGTAGDEIGLYYSTTGAGGGWTLIEKVDYTDGSKVDGVLCDYNWDPGTGLPLAAASNQVRLKVMSETENTIEAINAADFIIQGTMTLTYPSGGLTGTDMWPTGYTKNITWTLGCSSTGTVDIYYSLVGNDPEVLNWEAISLATVNASALLYPWTPPLGESLDGAFIWVFKNGDQTTGGKARFNLTPSIKVNQPNGSNLLRVLQNDASSAITWTLGGGTSISNVHTYYCTDFSTSKTWVQITGAGGTPAVAGTMAWEVPNAISSLCGIKVADFDNVSTIYDESDAVFAIKGWMDVWQPAASAKVDTSGNCIISWTNKGTLTGEYTIKYATDGTNFTIPVASTPGDFVIGDQTHTWTTPDTTGLRLATSKIKIGKVGDDDSVNGTVGISGAFKMLGSIKNVKVDGLENGTYNIGDTVDITWDAYPNGASNLGNVEIAYDRYAGEGPNRLVSNPPGSGDEYTDIIVTVDAYADIGSGTESHNWEIPDADVLYNEIRFQVRLAADWKNGDSTFDVHDETSSNTAIYGSLTLTPPAGTPWLCGDDKTIYWTRQGASMGKINLWLSNDDGNNYTVPIGPTNTIESSAGEYLWSIPVEKFGVAGTIFRDQDDGYNDLMKIKIVSQDFPGQVNNELASAFTVKSKIYSISPSGATVQIGDNDQDIIWSTDGDIPSINIRYDTGGVGTYAGTIASGVTNIGDGGSTTTFSTSTLPNGLSVPLSTDLKIMIESAAHYFGKPAGDEVYAVTADNEAVGMINILLPDGTEAGATALKANDTFMVTWTINNGAGKTGDKDMGDLTLYYAEDGNTFSTTVSSTIASSGVSSYEWTPLPNPTSIPIGTCKVKLVDNDDTSGLAQDLSEPFEIRGMLFAVQTGNDIEYALEDGNGGSVYESDISTPTIKWRYRGDIGTVAIYYDLDSGNNNYDQGPIVTIDHDYNDGGAPQTEGIAYYDAWTVPNIVSQKLRFKVKSTVDADVYAQSETDNEIKGNITLSAGAPGMTEGQADRYVDGTNNIAWTVTGGISEVDISLDTDSSDGLDYSDFPIVTGYIGASPYPWNIPVEDEADRVTVTSDKCQIKIEQGSYIGIAPQDVSNFDFKMKPRIFLEADPTEPQISTKWQVQETESLAWSTTGQISQLRLYFSVDNGGTWDTDLQATYTASDGAGTWSIPTDAVGHNQVKIKLVRYENPTEDTDVEDISPPFTVKGKIVITQPASAQTYNVGVDTSTGQTGSPFRWTVTGTSGVAAGIGDVELVYNYNEPTYPDVDWSVIGTDIQADGYSATDYDFIVPSQTAPKMMMRIREKAYNYVYGESQYEHEIIGSIKFDKPTAGNPSTKNQTIIMGPTDKHQIHWSLDGEFTGVNLYYKEVSDPSWAALGDGYMAGSIEQTDIGHHYDPAENEITLADGSNKILFKVEDALNNSIYAETLPADGNTVAGYLELLEPVTPDEFLVGEGIIVKWKKYGSIGDIKFELWDGSQYLNNAGGSNLPDSLPSGASGEAGVTYNWTVPDKISTGAECKIKITTTNALYPELSDEHTTAFTIKGAFDGVIAPTLATTWYVGDNHTVSWDATGTMSSVNIDLIIPGGGTNNIVTGYSGGSPYTWTYTGAVLQKQKTDAAQIKITSGNNAGVNITSDPFTFMPRITVTTPPAPLIAQVAPTVTWVCSAPLKTTLVDILVDMDGDDDWADAETLVLDNNGGAGVAVDASPRVTAVAIPATLSNSVKLRVRDHDTTNAAFVTGDTGPFRVIGEITISKPDLTCTDWKVGDTNRLIEWNVKGNIGDVKIYADYNGDGTPEETLNTYATSTGYNSWTWEDPGLPADEGIGNYVGNNVKIKIVDADAEGDAVDTAGPFSIIGGFAFTKPLGGTTFHIESTTPTYDIKWTAIGDNISKVKIEYWNTEDNAGLGGWRTLYNDAASADIDSPNHGATENSFTWKTTQTEPLPLTLASLGLKFRITSAVPAQPDTELESSTVVMCGDITVTSPTQGLIWTADGSTANTISWDVYGKCDNVKIEYSRDSETTWQTLDASYDAETGNAAANKGAWLWTIPISPSNPNDFITRVDAPTGHSSYIKVSDASTFGTYATDTSSNFIVKGQLTLMAPTVSSGLACGTNYIITWQRNGRINAVNVKYATDGINYTNDIRTDMTFLNNDATQQSTALADFKCPETPVETTYKLLVEDAEYEMAGTAGTFVESAAFRIKGALVLTAPLSTGLTWRTNETPHLITWNVTHGAILKVKIMASPGGLFNGDEYAIASNVDAYASFDSEGTPKGSGTHDLAIPESTTFGPAYKFKVEQDYSVITGGTAAYSDGDVITASTQTIKVYGNIAVTKPGAAWIVGDDTRQVQFNSWGPDIGSVYIYLFDNVLSAEYVIDNSGTLTATGDGSTQTYGGTGEFAVPDVKSH